MDAGPRSCTGPSQCVSASASCCLQVASPWAQQKLPTWTQSSCPSPQFLPQLHPHTHLAGPTQHSCKRRASLGEVTTKPFPTRLEGKPSAGGSEDAPVGHPGCRHPQASCRHSTTAPGPGGQGQP